MAEVQWPTGANVLQLSKHAANSQMLKTQEHKNKDKKMQETNATREICCNRTNYTRGKAYKPTNKCKRKIETRGN